MFKLIKSMIGGAPAPELDTPFGAERRAAERQRQAHLPERRISLVPQMITESDELPSVAEGNSDADWELWQSLVMAQDAQGAVALPPIPYERRKEPRSSNDSGDAVKFST